MKYAEKKQIFSLEPYRGKFYIVWFVKLGSMSIKKGSACSNEPQQLTQPCTHKFLYHNDFDFSTITKINFMPCFLYS